MNKTVLICDDDADILEVTAEILQSIGCTVETMMNVDETIADKVNEINPALILMDLWIPDIGGTRATELIKADVQISHVPVILFSANNDIANAAKKHGAQGFLPKPYDISDLINIVNEHLEPSLAN